MTGGKIAVKNTRRRGHGGEGNGNNPDPGVRHEDASRPVPGMGRFTVDGGAEDLFVAHPVQQHVSVSACGD